MAEAKKRLLTYAGLKAIEDELENLKVVKRKEVAGKIKEAREQGDLSENAEYDAAKDEQRDIEARIEELEAILKNAEVVVEDGSTSSSTTTSAFFKIFSISSIRASMSLCSSFAASYSAFSDKSPCSLASLIFSATSFLFTTFKSCSSSSNFLSPA